MILGEQWSKNFCEQKCKCNINKVEHNTLLVCIPMYLYPVLYNIMTIIYVFVIQIHFLSACLDYTHVRVHIHNCAEMILYVTCHKRLPVLSDLFCCAGGRSTKTCLKQVKKNNGSERAP